MFFPKKTEIEPAIWSYYTGVYTYSTGLHRTPPDSTGLHRTTPGHKVLVIKMIMCGVTPPQHLDKLCQPEAWIKEDGSNNFSYYFTKDVQYLVTNDTMH